MYVGLSREQEEFASACRKVLERDCPISLVRELAQLDTSYSSALFASLASLGIFEMAAPLDDEIGGLVELGIAYREAGRALVPTSLYSTVWAALCLNSAQPGSPWLDSIREGQLVATVAHAEESVLSLATGAGYQTMARRGVNEGWVLSGTKLFVPNADVAGLLLVVARIAESDNQIGLFEVRGDSANLQVGPMSTFGHDAQSQVNFGGVVLESGALVKGPLSVAEWREWFESVNDRATALQCMEMLGGAERVLEDTVDYVKQRHVFGRPIGSFQAAQHHIANLGIAIGAGRVAAYKALCDAASGEDARRSVSIAKSWLSKAYKEVTVMAHQLFGAMGYVRETDLHLWSQRAKSTELTFGDRGFHLARLADLTFDRGNHA
jgi:3-oxocholest-4-en-26-oyl-CoA dehydrogenase beta subunit